MEISIAVGSAQPSQTENFVPKEVEGALGLSNKFIWTNDDSKVPHTVTTDTGYEDPINGASIAWIRLVLFLLMKSMSLHLPK